MITDSVCVGIVDNDPLSSLALCKTFQFECPCIHVLWTASSGQAALSLLSKNSDQVQVLVTDLEMPEMSGFDLALAVRSRYPGTRVVGLSAFQLPGMHRRAEQSCIAGVLMKDSSLTQIVRLIGKAARVAALQRWSEKVIKDPLSQKEQQIMSLYAQGLTSSEIASHLSVSRSTVKTYAARAFNKLGVHTKAQALMICVRDGLF